MRTVDQLSKFGITGIQHNCTLDNLSVYTGYDQSGKEIEITLREPDGLVKADGTEYAASGVWTPWAAVVCMSCHGNVFKNVDYNFATGKFSDRVIDVESEEWARVTTLHNVEYNEGITYCDKCNKAITVNESVAHENNIVRELIKLGYAANMDQTGGMNSAACVFTADKKHYFYATIEDNWAVGKYEVINEEDHQWVEDAGGEFDTAKEVIDYLVQQNLLKLESDTNE